jgi:hypothetical protein
MTIYLDPWTSRYELTKSQYRTVSAEGEQKVSR